MLRGTHARRPRALARKPGVDRLPPVGDMTARHAAVTADGPIAIRPVVQTNVRSRSSVFTHRNDLQGLRAVAVLLVVLGHAGVPRFRGGFVGVDVFFVLSGYLITGV